ncbi:MAG: DUF6596 domain-containing protein [Thermodesulfobacteriota bacterium]
MKSKTKSTTLAQELKIKYEKYNLCFEAAYKGTNYEERDEYREVIKSTKELLKQPQADKPQTYALIAYMLLKASRLRAIINNVARVPDLKNQNRLLWDKRLINEGLEFINKSAGGTQVSEYHLRAGICACHALSKDYESTDWKKIVSLYDQYLEIDDSINIALERAYLICDFEGPKSAISALMQIDTKNNPERKVALNTSMAEFHIKLNEFTQAIEKLSQSHELSDNEKEKSAYLNKIEFCRQQIFLSKKYDQALSF